jgi:hypothetical protein
MSPRFDVNQCFWRFLREKWRIACLPVRIRSVRDREIGGSAMSGSFAGWVSEYRLQAGSNNINYELCH